MRGQGARQLQAGLEEPVIEGAGLDGEGRARTPGLASPIPRHADDQAHGVRSMLADAVPGCQRAARAAGPLGTGFPE